MMIYKMLKMFLFQAKNKWIVHMFLAPTGAQGVKMCVRLSVRDIVQIQE